MCWEAYICHGWACIYGEVLKNEYLVEFHFGITDVHCFISTEYAIVLLYQ